MSVEQFTSALINSTPKPSVLSPVRTGAAAHVSELQGHRKSPIRWRGLASKMHNILRLPSTGADQKTGGNKTMAKKILKKAKKLEATKPLTVFLNR
jgi:hypothetical protein